MMGKIFFMIALIPFSVLAALEEDVRCFSSNTNKVNLKFVEIYNGEAILGYVKYKGSDKVIPLSIYRRSEGVMPNERPVEVKKIWLELINGEVNGKYITITQASNYYEFLYESKSGKKTNLQENFGAYNDDHSDCAW